MKFYLLSLAILFPFILSAQSGPYSKTGPAKPIMTVKAIRSPNLSIGPALIGLGGLLIAGSQVYMVNSDKDIKTTTTILSATGGVVVLAGGILLGNALNKMARINSTGRIKFHGTGICVNL